MGRERKGPYMREGRRGGSELLVFTMRSESLSSERMKKP